MLLLVGPWTVFWERNYFVESPWLAPVLANHAFRGAVSGVGVVCLAAALAELWSLRPARLGPPDSQDAPAAPELDGHRPA